MKIRKARIDEAGRLTELWESSVRATHHFLTDTDIAALRPLVAEELAGSDADWWVLALEDDCPIGFLGYTPNTIEGLFLDPAHTGKGGGKMLIEHARTLSAGVLRVDVNEQNAAATDFYKRVGFTVSSRSPTDGNGRPFPLLHMQMAI
jgi:putative acetyltransferase